MNALDIITALIVGFCLIRGIFRGIIKEITSILGVFIGFYAAYIYYPILARWLSDLIANRSYLHILSFFLIFVTVLLAVGFVGMILRHLLKAAALGWADRILGGTFAMVKAVLIVSVLLIALTTFLPENAPVIKNSLLAPRVSAISEKLVAVVPGEMKERFRNNIRALRISWKKL
ncbi:MAG: CvpA family protein [Deltaproteobacteria bacterium]